jgi:hypothetical protein
MDNPKALYTLYGLLSFYQSQRGTPTQADRVLSGQGELALTALATALAIPVPTSANASAWVDYINQVYAANTPKPVPAAPVTNVPTTAPTVDGGFGAPVRSKVSEKQHEEASFKGGDVNTFIALADQIIKDCETLCKESDRQEAVEFADRLTSKAESMRDWLTVNGRTTLKMELALTNMRDAVGRWLYKDDKPWARDDDDTPPWER